MRRYAWGGVSVNYLILAFAIQWGLLCNGFWDQLQLRLKGGTDGLSAIPLTLVNFTRGNFVAAAVLISFGAVIGRVSPLQMVVLVFWQCICSTCNEFIGGHRLHVSDPGGSMFIHIFGASTGLALAWMIGDRPAKDGKTPSTTRHNGTFAMIGTLFLFLFWPSFNAGKLRARAVSKRSGQGPPTALTY
jgi:ammonium transporter Rh